MFSSKLPPQTLQQLGMTPEFEESFDWHGPPIDAENAKEALVAMVRMPSEGAFDASDRRLFAYDRSLHTEVDNERFSEENYQFLSRRLQDVAQPQMDFVKYGPLLVDTLGIDWDPRLAAFHLQLSEPDEDLSRAFFAALFTATNTAPLRLDWEAVILALAAFVHALPAYKPIVNNGECSTPFGEATGWRTVSLLPDK
jgi:hypothetical protein